MNIVATPRIRIRNNITGIRIRNNITGRALLGALLAAVMATACSGNVFDLEAGQCVVNDAEGEVSSVEVVECSEPHDQEVFALFDVDAGEDDPYPGDAAMATEGERCTGELFEDYVGVPYLESEFLTTILRPTDGSWAQGDREIVCLIVGSDGQLEGSAEGSNR